MTQKFHENETATIALYKYHDLLESEEELGEIRKAFYDNRVLDIEIKLVDAAANGDEDAQCLLELIYAVKA